MFDKFSNTYPLFFLCFYYEKTDSSRVWQGTLTNGTIIAVKQLSARSRQGNREFLNEIGLISCLQHPNLVKLHGCCTEGDELMLVYEYMENNCLANSLFGECVSGKVGKMSQVLWVA